MTLSVAISQAVFRGDSTILPIITGESDLDDAFVKIGDWQYIPFQNIPLTLIPPNKTLKKVPVILRDLIAPSWDFDSDISSGVGANIQRTAGEGYQGAVYNTPLDEDKCSIQAQVISTSLSTGISLQDGSGTIEHNYNIPTVAHSMIFGQDGQGSIRELGGLVSNNAYFKYEVNDVGMIEKDGDIVRYYLIKPDYTMQLLRTTRSKLTEAPKAEALLYFTGSALFEVVLNSNAEAVTYFENIMVFKNSDKLFIQKWGNQRSVTPIADTLEMADKRTEYTYPNQKKNLRSLALTPKAKSRTAFWRLNDLFNYHNNDLEFIFVDLARRDLEGNPTEFWARFQGSLTDQTINGCLFDNSLQIIEDFRNDYVPRQDDLIGPEVEIISTESGSCVITGTASDNVLLISLELYKNGFRYGDKFLPSNTDGDWTFVVPNDDMNSGLNYFFVIATDYAGNTTQTPTAEFNFKI